MSRRGSLYSARQRNSKKEKGKKQTKPTRETSLIDPPTSSSTFRRNLLLEIYILTGFQSRCLSFSFRFFFLFSSREKKYSFRHNGKSFSSRTMFIIEIQGEGFFRFGRERGSHFFPQLLPFLLLFFFLSPPVISLLSRVKRSDHFFSEKMGDEEEEEEGSHG